MSFLGFEKEKMEKFKDENNSTMPVSMMQYIVHYLYGKNEQLLMGASASMLSKAFDESISEEEREKAIKQFEKLSTGSMSKVLPHGIAMSRNAAKNLVDFVYYVEGTRGARLAVGPCICQLGTNKYPDGITEPEKKDITLFYAAEIYLDLDMNFVEMTNEEVKEVLDEMHKRGYVHNAYYMFGASKGLFVLCNCENQVCAAIKGQIISGTTLTKGPEICKRDESKCLGVEKCGKCIKRCQIKCNRADGDKIIYDRDKCIGCELCVTTCEGHARELEERMDYEAENILSKKLLLAGKYGYERLVPYEK